MQKQAIFAGVCDCVAQALDLNGKEIKSEAKLIEELGADSLDLLDIIFQLEQRFHIKLSVRHLEKRTQALLGDVPIEDGGVYSAQAIALLRKAMPEVPPEELSPGLTVRELPLRFRVATMVNLVQRTLEETP